jgi:putative redox protein
MVTLFERQRQISVSESGFGPYGQIAATRRHVFAVDEPEALGGNDTGPDPMELLATSLAACTAMTLRMYARRHKMELGRIRIDVSHEWLVSEAGERRDRFIRVVAIDPRPSDDVLARLRNIADRCPVHRTLTGDPQVDTEWR